MTVRLIHNGSLDGMAAAAVWLKHHIEQGGKMEEVEISKHSNPPDPAFTIQVTSHDNEGRRVTDFYPRNLDTSRAACVALWLELFGECPNCTIENHCDGRVTPRSSCQYYVNSIPEILLYIEDGLGKFELPDSRAINLALVVLSQRRGNPVAYLLSVLDNSHWMDPIGPTSYRATGHLMLDYQRHLVQQALETRRMFVIYVPPNNQEITFVAVDSPVLQDEIGEALLKRPEIERAMVRSIVASTYINHHLYGPDVGEIARKLGGTSSSRKAVFVK